MYRRSNTLNIFYNFHFRVLVPEQYSYSSKRIMNQKTYAKETPADEESHEPSETACEVPFVKSIKLILTFEA